MSLSLVHLITYWGHRGLGPELMTKTNSQDSDFSITKYRIKMNKCNILYVSLLVFKYSLFIKIVYFLFAEKTTNERAFPTVPFLQPIRPQGKYCSYLKLCVRGTLIHCLFLNGRNLQPHSPLVPDSSIDTQALVGHHCYIVLKAEWWVCHLLKMDASCQQSSGWGRLKCCLLIAFCPCVSKCG